MVAAVAGELSPVVTGFVYCGVIEGCREADELARAKEWTIALADWCGRQPDLVPFTGTCLLHRAEILQVHGDWDGALAEARLACDRFGDRRDRRAAGEASYRCGEILRHPRRPGGGGAARSVTPAATAATPAGARAPAPRAGTRRRGVRGHRGCPRRRRRLGPARPAAPRAHRGPPRCGAARGGVCRLRRAGGDRPPPRAHHPRGRRRAGPRRRRARGGDARAAGAAAEGGDPAVARARARHMTRRGRGSWSPTPAGRSATPRPPVWSWRRHGRSSRGSGRPPGATGSGRG